MVNLTYDALLRPTRIQAQAIDQRFATSSPTGPTAGQIQTPGSAAAPAGPIIADTKLTYNDVSNITQRETEHGLYTYAYDDLDRLTQVVPPASISFPNANGNATNNNTTNPNLNLPIEGYRYDAVHNRKSSLHQTGSLANAWTYNAHHQLTEYGDPSATSSSSLTSILHPKVTQAFNANGHLTLKTVTPEDTSPAGLQAGKQSQRYTYSVSERLLRISDGSTNNNGQGSEIARYAYDPFGRRIAKTVSQNTSGQGSTGTTLYFYADEGLIAEVDGNSSGGNITTTYGWMPNGTWGTAPQWKRDHAGQSGATDVQGSANTNGITHYVHVDHLGTSQRLTNTQGETTWRAVSEAFGKTLIDTTLAPATTGTTTNNLRFPGQYEDQETGTYYNYFRDYDPSVGRYVQSDPIGLRGGINTYAYVKGNPLKYIDPRGLDVWAGGEGGFTAQTPILIGGAASMGVLRNLSTGETCPYIMICPRLGLGMQLSAGFKVGVQSGPKCGKALTDFGLQVAADIVSPAGGVGANVGVGDRKLSGAGAGIGPGWGLGASIAFEFCWTVVNSAACKNTPCECQK